MEDTLIKFVNPYLLSYYLGATLNIIVMIEVARRVRRTAVTVWFQSYLATIVALIIAQTGQVLVTDPVLFDALSVMRGLALLMLPVTMLMFTLLYLGRKDISRSSLLHIFYTVPVLITAILMLHTDLVLRTGINPAIAHEWGYHIDKGPLFWLVSAAIQSGFLISFVLLFLTYRRTKIVQQRRPLKLLLIAVLIPYLGEVIVRVGLMWLNIELPPPDSYLNIVMSLIIGYAILRYGLLSVDPDAIRANVVKTMPSAVVALNEDREIAFVNEFASQFFGFPGGALVGRHIDAILPKSQEADRFAREVEEALAHQEYAEFLDRVIRTKAGKRVPVNVYASRLLDKRGRLVANVLVFTSIEELHAEKEHIEDTVRLRTAQLQEAQAQLISSINSLSQGFVMLDAHGELLVNHATRRMFFPRAAADATIELGDLAAKLKDAVDVERAVIACMKSQKSSEFPLVAYRDRFYRLYIGPVIERHRTIGAVLLIEDITEERILQRSRDEFFSIASHELRTPLTAIRGNTSMALDYFPEIKRNDTLHDMVDDMHESSVRLIGIVNDFLDTSRLEQGRMEFNMANVSVEKIAENIIYEMHTIINHRGIYLKADHTLDKLPLVRADANRLKQVIYNLVGNAAKFTDHGGIVLRAEANDKYLTLFVTDTGRGISPESQQLLFHKFQQANENLLIRDAARGTGLGLYISRLLMEHMGGSVDLVESKPGKGTTFSVTIPLALEKSA